MKNWYGFLIGFQSSLLSGGREINNLSKKFGSHCEPATGPGPGPGPAPGFGTVFPHVRAGENREESL